MMPKFWRWKARANPPSANKSPQADVCGATSLVEYAAGTTVGACRADNEDAWGVFEQSHVFVVADGVGGPNCGENAARIAVASFEPSDETTVGTVDPLVWAALRANTNILRDSAFYPERKGQAATLCAVQIASERMSIVHVGDCRVGHYVNGQLSWLTEDHTVLGALRRSGASPEAIEEAMPHWSAVLHAVGLMETVQPELQHYPARTLGVLLLCSDGIPSQVEDARIAEILGTAAGDLSESCRALLDASETAGGIDNATVLLVRMRSTSSCPTRTDGSSVPARAEPRGDDSP